MANTIIIGGAGGIGAAAAQLILARGGRVLILGRNIESLEFVTPHHTELQSAACDARDKEQLETAVKTFIGSDTLFNIVNCAGSVLLKPAHATSTQEFMQVIETNLLTAFNTVSVFGKLAAQGSSAVLISSCAARIGLANHEAIAAAKAGIEGLMRSAAATYAPKGLRFNCIAPGLVRTSLTKAITGNQAAAEYSVSLHPLKRFGEVDDIAGLIEFLTSSKSSWITGQVMGADGGLSTLKTK
jgi:NAD(P)-dependent dehydrogenase (short-subunit alcohol dehydrogenase family)